jgi:hypothetical protein
VDISADILPDRTIESNWATVEISYPELHPAPRPSDIPLSGSYIFQAIWRASQEAAQSGTSLFDFASQDAYTTWSGILAGDSIAVIGYAPEGQLDIDWTSYEHNSYAWKYARRFTIGFILNELTKKISRIV